jgi:hypothetical protein
MQPVGSQDVKFALKNAVVEIFPDMAESIYFDDLPTIVERFPNFLIRQLQVLPRQSTRQQLPTTWQNVNVFLTLEYRIFGGGSSRPDNLQAQLDDILMTLSTQLTHVNVGGVWKTLQNVVCEKRSDAGIALTIGAFDCNVDVLLATLPPQGTLQKELILDINRGDK